MTCQLEPWKRGQRKWVQSTACAPGEAAPDSGVYGHLFSYYCCSWRHGSPGKPSSNSSKKTDGHPRLSGCFLILCHYNFLS